MRRSGGQLVREDGLRASFAGLYAQPRLDTATYQRLFFEWGHPAVRDFCRERGLAYPPLNAEGEIDNPSRWYTEVREGIAPREDK